LAKKIGVTQAALSVMKGKQEIGARQFANFLKRVVESKTGDLLAESIQPIVEYFPIDAIQKRDKSSRWYAFDETDHPELAKILKAQKGIYAFYNSEGRLIYLGKAERSLLLEMTQTFNRNFRDNYVIFAVGHPRNRFKPKPNGKLRGIRKQQAILADTARFFSAYAVQPDMIGSLEALLIRVSANSLINVRMERGLKQISAEAASEV
jgi:hypothetical protein